MKTIMDHSHLLEFGESEIINRIIAEWQPTAFDVSEKELEDDLFKWFLSQLPDVPMTTQYGIAKGKADIVIEDSHVLELKLGLTDVAEFDRCIGQLERYRQKWVDKDRGTVCLVIIGESDTEFRSMLHTWIERTNLEFFGQWFHLIEKRQVLATA